MGAFLNDDLNFEIEKIKEFDLPITVSKSYDDIFDYSFSLDIEDSTYWYATKEERDKDFETLKILIPNFTYVED